MRDADTLMAYFYTLDCATYTLQEIKLPQKLTWWQGLEDAHQGNLYFHGYADRQLGQHRGITAIKAATGELQWESLEQAFYGVVKDGILSYPATDPEANYTLLDAALGKTITPGIKQQEAIAEVTEFSHKRYSQCRYPILYKEGEEYFEQVRNFILATVAGAHPVQAIEYAETDSSLIISFYSASAENKIDNILLIFNLAGELLLQEILGTGLSGIGSDTFFIFESDLYFIQNKDTLKAYKLIS